MKIPSTYIKNSALAFVILTQLTQGQSTVSTPVVGFSTVTVAGGGTSSAPKYTMAALNLLNPQEYSGTMTSSFNGSFTSGAFNAGTFPKYYLSIPSTGLQADIVSNTSSNLTVDSARSSSVASALGSGVRVEIRKHRTLQEVFGGDGTFSGGSGLTLGRATSASAADGVLLFANGAYKTYFYSSLTTRPGWRDAGNTTFSAAEAPVYPNEGVFIARKLSSSVSITVSGHVASGVSLIELESGNNLITATVPADTTLAGMFGGDGTGTGGSSLKVGRGTSASATDNILIWDGSSFKTYFYSSLTTRPGWRDAGNTAVSAATTPISGNQAFILKRSGSAVNLSYTNNY